MAGMLGWLPAGGPWSATVSAQTPPASMTLIDGEMFPADPVRVRSDGTLEVVVQGQSRTVPADRFWSWGRWRGRHAVPQVALVDGSWLTVDDPLGLGAAVDPQEDECPVRLRHFGTVHIPVDLIAGAVLAWPSDPVLADLLADSLGEPASEDSVGLASGDEIHGRIERWSSNLCRVQNGEGSWDFPASRLAWVHFGGRRRAGATEASTWVALADGSHLRAATLELGDGRLAAGLTCGLRLRTEPGVVSPAALESLQRSLPSPASGPSATSAITAHLLSGQLLTGIRQTGWMRRSWPLGVHRTADGGWLRCHQETAMFGLSMHAPAEAEFELAQPSQWFVTRLGIESSTGSRGSVIFRVLARTTIGEDWVEAFRSEVIRGGEPPRDCRVPLDGATGIRLVVEVADHGHVLDRALWLDARVIHHPPE